MQTKKAPTKLNMLKFPIYSVGKPTLLIDLPHFFTYPPGADGSFTYTLDDGSPNFFQL